LITGDKQKLFDQNVHTSGKTSKNFYTEFKTVDPARNIQFFLNNEINIIISNQIKLFLKKFVEISHNPESYNTDALGIKLINKCKTIKCDFFEKFMGNIKTMQKLYFPTCDETCICPPGKFCPKCTCAVDGNLITRFQ
jgi:hypothetical protein